MTGQLLGEMLQRKAIRRLALVIVSEVMDVAEAHGVSLEPVGGTLDLYRLYLPSGRRAGGFSLDVIFKHAIILAVGLSSAASSPPCFRAWSGATVPRLIS